MPKDERLGIRVPRELKKALAEIAAKEERSLAQVCEIFLRAGLRSYEKRGSSYLKDYIVPPLAKK
jgi:hypothetical protein